MNDTQNKAPETASLTDAGTTESNSGKKAWKKPELNRLDIGSFTNTNNVNGPDGAGLAKNLS